MHALRGHGPSRSPGGCGPRPHPPVQGRTPTHLAIYHHPQPRQLIASPRARPRARRGRSPRPAHGAAGRPAAGLMARPPVPARPGAPRPSPMPLPLSAPRLASPRSWPLGPRCSVPPELPELGTGGRRQRGPAPAPPSSPAGARGGPRCASWGQAWPPSPPSAGDWTWDVGLVSKARRAHVTPPSRAHAPLTERFFGLISPVSLPSRLRSTPAPAEFRVTATRVESRWTWGRSRWRSWTFCYPGTPTPPAVLFLVAVDSETGRKVKSLLQSLPGSPSLLSLLFHVTTENQVASGWYAG